MKKCSICGRSVNIRKFKSGYICDDCLSLVKETENLYNAENPYPAEDSQGIILPLSIDERSKEKVHGSEKQ